MQKRDTRIKSTTEMVNLIKVIKMGGMEDKFFGRVNQKRDEELNLLKKQYHPYIFTIFCPNHLIIHHCNYLNYLPRVYSKKRSIGSRNRFPDHIGVRYIGNAIKNDTFHHGIFPNSYHLNE